MIIPKTYQTITSLRDKILFVFTKLEKASADEVAMEIMELDGISSEDGVSEITLEVNNEIKQLCEEGVIHKIKEHRQKVRYTLINGNGI